MRLIHFAGNNFGDALNLRLWPRLLGEFDPEGGPSRGYFCGIGSLLFHPYYFSSCAPNARCIVFGAGVRPPHFDPPLELKLDIRFVRGPRSAAALGLEPRQAIADGAYALGLLPDYRRLLERPKRHTVTLIPHFSTLPLIDWDFFSQLSGINVLSPSDARGAEYILDEIAASGMVIGEAMHGCIVADVLRVPWVRLKLAAAAHEGEDVHEFKWMDWMDSIGIEAVALDAAGCQHKFGGWLRGPMKGLLPKARAYALHRLIARRIGRHPASLSGELDFERVLDRLANEVTLLRGEW